jgi:hypothetical protein
MYKNGLAGLAVNYVKARELCLKAAEQKAYLKRPTNEVIPNLGVAEAENFIGMSYQFGMGVAKVYYLENFRISLTYARLSIELIFMQKKVFSFLNLKILISTLYIM